MEASGTLGIMKVRLVATAPPSTISVLENANVCAEKMQHELTCGSKEGIFADLHKVKGHVLQPLKEYLVKKLDWANGPGWTVRRRIAPNFKNELGKSKNRLDDMVNGAAKKVQKDKISVNLDGKAIEWNQQDLLRERG